MQIEKHDKSYIVKLDDGSSWRIWPGDIALTLGWSPTTVLEISEIDDEFCSHALIDKTDGSRVRVIEASKDWPVQQVRQSFLNPIKTVQLLFRLLLRSAKARPVVL